MPCARDVCNRHIGTGLPLYSEGPSPLHLHYLERQHGKALLVQLVKGFAKGTAIPYAPSCTTLRIQAAMQLCLLLDLLFEELLFGIVQDKCSDDRYNNSDCKENTAAECYIGKCKGQHKVSSCMHLCIMVHGTFDAMRPPACCCFATQLRTPAAWYIYMYGKTCTFNTSMLCMSLVPSSTYIYCGWISSRLRSILRRILGSGHESKCIACITNLLTPFCIAYTPYLYYKVLTSPPARNT